MVAEDGRTVAIGAEIAVAIVEDAADAVDAVVGADAGAMAAAAVTEDMEEDDTSHGFTRVSTDRSQRGQQKDAALIL